MKTISELNAAIANKVPLIWNDPDPSPGNDYRIHYIEPISDEFKNDTPILITYNGGGSEAEAYLHEIKYDKS